MLGGLFGGSKTLPEKWEDLTTADQLNELIERSFDKTQVIFKHSTRCSISSMAYSRLSSNWKQVADKADLHYLDLIAYRDISNAIAERFNVHHESPQILVIENGKCTSHASHNGVGVELLK